MMILSIVSKHHQYIHPTRLSLDTLHKLCYLVDSTFYQKYEISMTGESYIHTQNGPVPIHFDDSLDELITDNRVSVSDNGNITPCEAYGIRSDSVMDDLGLYRVSMMREFGHLSHHILPRPTPRENEIISEITSRYARMDSDRLEMVVKRDPGWKLSSEGQLIDYEYVFYRKDEQEASNDEE